tara:strand:+ start:3769 stop:3906 length:138 start_codon:yes stop_codon:yes gene_type:complete
MNELEMIIYRNGYEYRIPINPNNSHISMYKTEDDVKIFKKLKNDE